MRVLGRLGLLVAALSCAACATVGAGASTLPGSAATRGAPADLGTREQRVLAALAKEDFEAARSDLLWIASRCEAGARRTQALLVLAAAELDPTNRMGSPRAAAVAAAADLQSADASADQLPVARALFRLAADRGALDSGASAEPTVALVELAVSCGGDVEPSRGLPSVPPTSLAQRIDALEAALASRSDSLAVVTTRVGTLEAELRRIASILRDDAMPLTSGPGRP